RCEIMPSSSSRRIAGESKIPGSKLRPSIPRRRSCCCRSASPNSCSVIFCPPTLATSPTPAVSRWVHWIPQKANGGTIISASTNCRSLLCLVTKSNMVSLDEKRRTAGILAERTGLEPATPGVTGRYSNQLTYRSEALQCFYCRGGTWMCCLSDTGGDGSPPLNSNGGC